MVQCEKRQKVTKRSEGITILRCMNRRCVIHAQEVDDDICSRCPTPVVKHVSPCRKPRPQPPLVPGGDVLEPDHELIDLDDPEIREMIEAAGFDVKEIESIQKNLANADVRSYPAISLQLWSFKEALIKWNKAGRPTRTQEEVDHIHREFCAVPCEWYDEGAGRCRGCGCKVTTGSIAVFNKIKMATEHCPKDKW